MSAATMTSSFWILLAPETGLIALILLVLGLDLFTKLDQAKLILFSILGLFLLFGTLVFVWPLRGNALNGLFQVHALATFLKFIFLGAGLLTLVITKEFTKNLGNRASNFILLILLSVLGAFFLASTNDLISLFITIEWMTLSLYILTAFLRTDAYSLEAGTKYLVMGAFSSAVFLYGISFIYGTAGSIRFEAIREVASSAHQSPLFLFGFLLILSGIGFKIAAFPFQLWAPDVYQGAPTPVTAFLSVASKTAGFTALVKVLFAVIGPDALNWSAVIAVISGATLLYGNLGALAQTNMKRLFAYSSIGHAGYLLMGIAAGTSFGLQGTLFYLAAYAISNLTAFLVIVIANEHLGSGEIIAYRGLAKKSPFLAGSFFIALLSLGGIPPLVGFFGKFLVLQAAVWKGYLWLALLGAANVIVSLYYYLSVIKEMYFKPPVQNAEQIQLGILPQFSLGFLVASMVGLGIFQAPLFYFAHAAAQTLF
ncbi:MAG: NADH-quinone oxidoreductase subunit N [Candidatus Omnitrophica bacterium]|nr:NADH-quinone oxidoreductase subunit N [Candidatus Omnitrophota bacterium]